MATRPELHIAVAKTKSKASEYNENFELMMDYIDNTLDECKDYVDDFMPSVTNQSGKFLTNDGTSTSWIDLLGTNNTFSGNTTMSGTLTVSGNVTFSGSSFSFPMCTTKATTTSTASNSKVAVVVENYKNGSSWYRVWSDGWIEQGGNAIAGSSYASGATVNLLKNFSDTNYTVLATINMASNPSNGNSRTIVLFSKAKGNFKSVGVYGANAGSDYPYSWYACGY